MRLNKLKKYRGFTLIELLVVIAIIGILSTLAIIALGDAKAKARDARRFIEIRSLRDAVEFYYNDNGIYPDTGGSWHNDCSYSDGTDNPINGWIPNIVPTYISKLPVECSNSQQFFAYMSNGVDYKIKGYCESSANRNTICNEGGAYSNNWFEVWSPGGNW